MKKNSIVALLVSLFAVSSGACQAPAQRTEKGALLGGLLGAGIGAAAGSGSHKTGQGAAIGAVAGAITGAVVGNEIDKSEEANRAYIEQQMGRQMAGAATYEDVIAMTRAGLGDEVITAHLRAHGVARSPNAQDLIWLKQNGVSDVVLRTMQMPPQQPVIVRQAPAPRPIIVEERYYAPYYYGPRCYAPPYYHHHHSPPPRVGWGVEFHSR